MLSEFLRSLRENLKTGLIAWLILLLIGSVLAVNLYIAVNLTAGWAVLLMAFDALGLALLAFTLLYAPAVLSRFHVGVKSLLGSSLKLAFAHLPSTLLQLLIVAFCVFAIVVTGGIGLLFFPVVCALLCSFIMERVLRKHTPPDEAPDAWYSNKD